MKKVDLKLVAVHNISETGLGYADKLGGLACPSLAVVRNDIGMSNFGDITLVANPAMINPRKEHVFDCDVYSSRRPTSFFKVDKPSFKAKLKEIASLYPEIADEIQTESISDRFKKNNINELANFTSTDMMPLAFAFSRDIGCKPRLFFEKIPARFEMFQSRKVLNWAAKNNGIEYGLDDKNLVALGKIIVDEINLEKKKTIELFEEHSDRTEEMYEENLERVTRRAERTASGKREAYLTPINGIPYPNKFAVLSIAYDYNNKISGTDTRIDIGKTIEQLNKITDKHKSRYTKWLADKFESCIVGEYFRAESNNDAGYTIKELTLSNLVREMSRSIRDAEGFNYGAGNIRSVIAREFKSFSEMEQQVDRIIVDDEFQKKKEELNTKVIELSMTFKEHSRYGGSIFQQSDNFCLAVKDYAIKGQRAWLKDYKEESLERIGEVDALLDMIKHSPTTYFEAKFKRAVSLSEFDVAIVPSDISKKSLQILKDSGLMIKEYQTRNEQDRIATLNECTEQMFGNHGLTEIPEKSIPTRKKDAKMNAPIAP